MERKVVRQGPNTLMVSLPIKWAVKNGIKKGDTLSLTEERNCLIVSKGEAKERLKKAALSIKKEYTKQFIRVLISNLFKRGYDLIEIKIPDDKSVAMVQRAVDSLMGIEITEQGKDTITAKYIAKELDSEFENFLRKTFYMLFESARIIEEDMAKGKYPNENQVEQLNLNIKKFTDVCKRSINKNDIFKEKSKLIYIIVWTLEKIANEYMYIYKKLAEKKPKAISKGVVSFFGSATGYLRKFYESYYGIKSIELDEFVAEKDRLYWGESYKLIEKTKQPVLVMHMANIVRLTHNMVSPLAGIRF